MSFVAGLVIGGAAAVAFALLASAWRKRRHGATPGHRRVLVPFTRGELDPTVLRAAIRIARAEDATLVPAYLIVTPLEYTLDTAMGREVERAMPLLEAVEHAALRAGVPVDARVENGRTPIHALERLWNVEHFDRVVAAAPAGRAPGFSPKDLMWILTHAPSETVILRPEPPRAEKPAALPRPTAQPLRGRNGGRAQRPAAMSADRS